jgi:alkyl hydroperoxide reductase subunit AhpF
MAIFNDQDRQKLTGIFAALKDRVQIVYFTQEFECAGCRETSEFLEEVCALNGKLVLRRKDFEKDRDEASRLGVERIPGITILTSGGEKSGVNFYGVPAGYEINSFIASVLEMSGVEQPFAPDVARRIAAIARPLHIQVFVSLSCPYCPAAVITAPDGHGQSSDNC